MNSTGAPTQAKDARLRLPTLAACNLTIGRRKPRLAVAGLWGMAAFRTAIAVHNIRAQRSSMGISREEG